MAVSLKHFLSDLMIEALAKNRPIAGMFELTSRCNFQCKMCYICGQENHNSLKERELTAAQWIELGRQARDAGLLLLTLTGGEIFIRKDFWQIYEAYTQMGFIITLFTNGSLLNDDMIGRLAKLPPFEMSISLYGASPETYGYVTGHPEAYDKVVSNIRKLTDAGIKVHLKTTVIKYNSGEFDKILELAHDTGHNLSIVNYISPRREGAGTDPLSNRLSPDELAVFEYNAFRAMKKMNDAESGSKLKVSVDDVMVDNNTEELVKALERSPTDKKFAFTCAGGRCSVWLSWEGKMFPCGLLCDLASEPLTVGFEKAWSEVGSMCRKVPVCEECDHCESRAFCMTCPARRKLETGVYDKAPRYLCQLVKAEAEVAKHHNETEI